MSKLHEDYSKEVSNFFDNLSNDDFEEVSCLLCGKAKRLKLFQKKTLHVYRCECGHVYSGYQPTQEALDLFYTKSNAMTQWSELKKTDFENLRQRNKYQKIVDFIKANDVSSVLDIGCGNGFFLNMLPNDITRIGTDQNKVAVKVAQAQGLTAYDFSISEILNVLQENDHKYDCITLFGVLEHLKDPSWLLNKLKKHVNKYLIAIVPNVDSAIVRQTWAKCFTFCPQHLHYFSLDTMWELFKKSGFNEKEYWTIESELKPLIQASHGLDPYQDVPDWFMDSIYSTELHNLTSESILKLNQGYKIVFIGEAQ